MNRRNFFQAAAAVALAAITGKGEPATVIDGPVKPVGGGRLLTLDTGGYIGINSPPVLPSYGRVSLIDGKPMWIMCQVDENGVEHTIGDWRPYKTAAFVPTDEERAIDLALRSAGWLE